VKLAEDTFALGSGLVALEAAWRAEGLGRDPGQRRVLAAAMEARAADVAADEVVLVVMATLQGQWEQ